VLLVATTLLILNAWARAAGTVPPGWVRPKPRPRILRLQRFADLLRHVLEDIRVFRHFVDQPPCRATVGNY